VPGRRVHQGLRWINEHDGWIPSPSVDTWILFLPPSLLQPGGGVVGLDPPLPLKPPPPPLPPPPCARLSPKPPPPPPEGPPPPDGPRGLSLPSLWLPGGGGGGIGRAKFGCDKIGTKKTYQMFTPFFKDLYQNFTPFPLLFSRLCPQSVFLHLAEKRTKCSPFLKDLFRIFHVHFFTTKFSHTYSSPVQPPIVFLCPCLCACAQALCGRVRPSHPRRRRPSCPPPSPVRRRRRAQLSGPRWMLEGLRGGGWGGGESAAVAVADTIR